MTPKVITSDFLLTYTIYNAPARSQPGRQVEEDVVLARKQEEHAHAKNFQRLLVCL